MAKTELEQDFQDLTPPSATPGDSSSKYSMKFYSNKDLCEYFLRGETWVKEYKRILREVYPWFEEDNNPHFGASGKLSSKGFEAMRDLHCSIGIFRIEVKRGKRVAVKCEPKMDLEGYKAFVLNEHQATPEVLDWLESEECSVPVADPGSAPGVRVIELIEVELVEDDSEEVAEVRSSQLARLEQANRDGMATFLESLNRYGAAIGAKIEDAIVTAAQQSKANALSKVALSVSEDTPTEETEIQVTKKPATRRKRS